MENMKYIDEDSVSRNKIIAVTAERLLHQELQDVQDVTKLIRE